jgi:hypothetical protein
MTTHTTSIRFTPGTTPPDWLAPLRAATYLQQFVIDLQRAQAQAVDDSARDLATLAEEMRAAPRPQDVLGLQAAFALEQCARLSQLSNRVLASVFEAQSRFTRDAEALVQGLLRQTFAGADGRLPTASGGALFGWTDPSPASWFAATQLSWNEGVRCWLDALDHDIEDKAAVDAEQRPRRSRH